MIKIILFIWILIMLCNKINPKKYKTIHNIMEETIKNTNGKISKDVMKAVFVFSSLVILIPFYSMIFITVPLKWFQILTAFFIVWSCFDLGLMFKVLDGVQTKLADSKVYLVISRIIDISYIGFIIYYIIMNW